MGPGGGSNPGISMILPSSTAAATELAATAARSMQTQTSLQDVNYRMVSSQVPSSNVNITIAGEYALTGDDAV